MPNMPDDIYIYKIAIEYGLAPLQDGKYDLHYNDDNIKYTVLANYRDKTNCLVKFEPKDFT